MHAYINPDIYEHLCETCHGKSVVDFGAGSLELADMLVSDNIATRVLAIDKLDIDLDYLHRRLTFERAYFDEFPIERTKGFDIAIVSWPNLYNMKGLESHLLNFDTVIYLGKNTDSTAAGSDEFWEHVRHRSVILYEPYHENVLIVYGPRGERREWVDLYHEEQCAIDRDDVYPYSDDKGTLVDLLGDKIKEEVE